MGQSYQVQALSWFTRERMFLTVVLISCLSLQFSEALFGTPSSTCSRDSQCGAFRRSQCLGTSFIFCFGPSRAYTVRGRCLNRSNFFCDVGSKYPPGPDLTSPVCLSSRRAGRREEASQLSLQRVCPVSGGSGLHRVRSVLQ